MKERTSAVTRKHMELSATSEARSTSATIMRHNTGLLLLVLPLRVAALRAGGAFPVPCVSSPRCSCQIVAKVGQIDESPAIKKARSALLEEVSRDERSLQSIASLLSTLETGVPPPKKLKRAVLGDWKLVFASDEAAVAPFTAGGASGPFAVLEDVYMRLKSDDVQAIEVIRKVGPFGNTAQSLFGKWSVAGADGFSWRTKYMVNENSREVEPPKDAPTAHAARATHVSAELLVLRRDADSGSYVIWTKLGSGELKKQLDDYAVDSENIMAGIP